MAYDENTGIRMTHGSQRGSQPDWPPEKPARKSPAPYVVMGIFLAVFLLCGTAALLTKLPGGLSLPSAGPLDAAPAPFSGPNTIQAAVQQYLLSSDNPMRSLNAEVDYHFYDNDPEAGLKRMTVTVMQKTEKTYCQSELQLKWKLENGEYQLVSLYVSPGTICCPLQAPGEETSCALAERLAKTYPDAQFQMDFSQWQARDSSFTAGVVITQPSLTYIEETSAQITLNWSVPEEAWQADGQSFQVLEQAVDFSPLNGTWHGVYSHPSTYLSENDIPFTITFSSAGRAVLDSSGRVNATVTVQHTLNDLWNTYQTDQYNVHYESGSMNISRTSYGYYQIEFDETNTKGVFKHPCKVKIHSDEIWFEDALVGKGVSLQK